MDNHAAVRREEAIIAAQVAFDVRSPMGELVLLLRSDDR